MEAPSGFFRGPDPTIFHFVAIPSRFETAIGGIENDTGYHIVEGDLEIGSYSTAENFYTTR